MQKIIRQNGSTLVTTTWLLIMGFLITIPACKKPEPGKKYQQINLVANTAGYHAARIDPHFVNGWGIAFGPSGVAWVSAQGPGLSEVWDKDGIEKIPGGVAIPSATNANSGGQPSGQVFNGTSDFKLSNGRPAIFIFAGLDGIISGWNGSSPALVALDDSKSGANYTGIAMAQDGGSNFLYVANFSAHKIDVYDKNWAEVNKPFHDAGIPGNYSPFNIQNVNGQLYVMYAKIANGDEVKQPGLGFVDIYNPDGSLDRRFISHGPLNAPWGVAAAPRGFWGDNDKDDADGIILVGNFGDGRINAFNKLGILLGTLKRNGEPIKIEGLWGISFPPSTSTVDPGRLYFAAGPADESNGLFGYIKNLTTGE